MMLAHVNDQFRNHHPLRKQWRNFRFLCPFSKKYLQQFKAHPSLSGQVTMGFLKLKRSDLEILVIMKEQLWSLPYQVRSNIDSDSFDTTQLCILKRYICSIYQAESGLVNNIEADVMRPYYFRNLYADHIAAAILPYKKFNQLWLTLEVFLIWSSGCISYRLQENVKWTMIDTKTSSFDSLQEVELQRCMIIWYIENSADNQSVRIDIRLVHILDSKTENCSIGRAVIEKDIIWRRIRSETENSVNVISAIREGVIPCGKQEEEQFYFGWFAGNVRSIYAADTNIPPATSASTKDEMVQKMAQHVSVYTASSGSPKNASYSTPIGVTEDPSDFISVRHGDKPKKRLNDSFGVKIDLLDVLSVHYKLTKEQPLIKSREKVNLLSSRRKSDISSLVKVFFMIVGKVLDVRSNGNKTSLHILSESDVETNLEKEMLEDGSNKRKVNDIDLQDKKKHILQHQIRLPFEQLPQPILNRDAIVCFVEGQTRDTIGGSSVSPAEHTELRDILNQLASDDVPGPLITMKYEMLRLCTMKSFPGRDRPFAIRIVGAGFYYAGNRDQVICYYCGSRKDNWAIADNPLSIHKTLFPSCSFLTNNVTVNVPIIKTSQARSSAEVHHIRIETSNGSHQLDTAQSESSLMSLPSKQPQVNVASGNHQMLITNKGSPANQLMSSGGKNLLDSGKTSVAHVYSMEDPLPMYPQYSLKTIRINSFQGWPVELVHRPEEMAECGFFYAGFSDCVRCFNCGVGLRQWINEDDPWIEHARWSTSCLYVLKMKGNEFVSLVKMAVEIVEREEASSQNDSSVNQSSQHNAEAILADTEKEDSYNKNATTSTAPGNFTSNTGCQCADDAVGAVAALISSTGNAEAQKYLLTDAAQSVLDMGYEAKLVLRAIERVLIKKGTVELTGQMIMEAVFEIEEDKGNSKLLPTSKSEQENKRTAKDTAAAEIATAEEHVIDPEQIMQEYKELREVTLCKICLDKTISVGFLPCGHLVACLDCASAMRKCPICRSLIKRMVKTILG